MKQFALKRFRRDENGNFAIMTSLALVPLAMAAGLAIDTGFIAAERAHLQNALDAGALAVASAGKHISNAEAREIAEKFIEANFDPKLVDLEIDRDGTKVTLKADTRTGLAFGSLFGYDDWHVGAASSADIAYNKYELALVLDTTGSMKGGKLAAMKDAVIGLIDTMSDQIKDDEKLKFAVVPFANFVNVGGGHGPAFKKNGKVDKKTGAGWLDIEGESDVPQLELVPGLSRFELFKHLKQDWKGCIETRHAGGKTAHDVSDTPADPKDDTSLFVPAFAIDEPDEEGYSNSYIASDADPFDKSAKGQLKKLLKYGVAVVDTLAPILDWSTPKVNYSGGKGPNKGCVTQPILPLGNDYREIKRKVGSLEANGTTNIMEGVTWGMRVLSPHEPFTEGRTKEPGVEKIMVVLTDGANVFGNNKTKFGSSYSSHGFLADGRLGIASGSAKDTNTLMNAKTLTACENAKKAGTEVYTIRLEEPDVATGTMLKECASSPNHFFDAPSRRQLDDVFQKIRERVVRVRISS